MGTAPHLKAGVTLTSRVWATQRTGPELCFRPVIRAPVPRGPDCRSHQPQPVWKVRVLHLATCSWNGQNLGL